MSVLIKGIEMPTKCEECEWSTTDRHGFFGCRLTGNIVIRKREQDRPNWCPLIPVPKHGRLIDADALLIDMTNLHVSVVTGWLYVRTSAIDNAPTIIPADPANKEVF